MRRVVSHTSIRRGLRVVSGLGAFLLLVSVSAAAPALGHDSAAGPAAVTITIRSGLSDRDVRVSAGEIVRFVNRDGERHRMRSRSGEGFDTGDLEPGQAYQVRLSAPGTYSYIDERDDDASAYRGRIVVSGGGSASGGAAGDGTAGAGTPSEGSAGGSTGGSVATSATVTIGDDFYQPTVVRIAAGGSVTFRNTGGDEHSATSSAFDTGVLGGGASARETFDTAGTFSFLCIFHSDMRGTIDVVAATGPGTTEPEAPRPSAASGPIVDQTPTPVPAPTATPSPSAAPTATPQLIGAPSDVSVDAADFAFRPATIDVAAGGRVTWTNRGVAPHSVTADDGAFDSGMLEAGATFAQTFETPGSYAYLCAFHAEMTATIEVVATTPGSGTVGGESAPAGPGGQTAGASSAPGDAAAPPAGAVATEVPTRSAEARATALTAERSAATNVSSLAGLALAITLVSSAAALFSRAVRGTVREAE